VGTQSGIVGQSFFPSVQAVQAWVASINATGGIKCHPVKYIVDDDGGDPAANQAHAQQLVNSDHVVALVQADAALSGQASVPFLTQHHIPVIGNEGGSDWFYSSPNYFPQMSTGQQGLISIVAATAAIAVPKGQTKTGEINCIEATFCSSMGDVIKTYGPKFGLDVVYQSGTSLVTPDFTSYCEAAKDKGVQTLIAVVDGASIVRMQKSCASVNYHPTFATGGIAASPAAVAFPPLNGMILSATTLPQTVTSNPAVRDFLAVMKRYAPQVVFTGETTAGWSSAKLFQLGAERATDPTTPEGILAGMGTIKNETLGGMTYPLTFTVGKNAPRETCFFAVVVQNGAPVVANDGKMICKT
jgi:branched-chain amino acid transport system substrate-binding protein